MKSKLAFWVITSVLAACVVYALIATVIMPVMTPNILPKAIIRTVEEKEKTVKGEKTAKGEKPVKTEKNNPKNDDSISSSTASHSSKDEKMNLFEIRKKEVLLDSRLELANDDSMYLVLDLANNLAILEMKGISLFESKILKSTISNSIKMYHTEALINWVAEPFMVKRVDATIPKIEFVEKIAPKDSIEANKIAAEPVAHKLGDVFIVLDFDRNLRLVISQSEEPDADGKKLIDSLRWKYKDIEIKKSIQSITKLNRQPAMPQIDIVLPKSDATILYKALPLKPKMILQL